MIPTASGISVASSVLWCKLVLSSLTALCSPLGTCLIYHDLLNVTTVGTYEPHPVVLVHLIYFQGYRNIHSKANNSKKKLKMPFQKNIMVECFESSLMSGASKPVLRMESWFKGEQQFALCF